MTEERGPVVSLLGGVRVVDCSILSPAGVGQQLADLGAEVVKVEAPGSGDYVRTLTWPLIDGVSLEHWHWNRGKRSLVLDLRTPDGVEVFCDLAAWADVVIEGMRPGGLDRRGLTAAKLQAVNPRLVLVRVNGYGTTGPYRNVPAHGPAFDAMAGLVRAGRTDDGYPTIPPHTAVGINAVALHGALAAVAGVVRARETGLGCVLEVAQSDAAVSWNWFQIEGELSYERPEDEVTGRDGGARRPVGYDGFGEAVRFQYYATADGHVLLMASDDEHWRKFCGAVERLDLYEAHPGAERGEHALGNIVLRRELVSLFAERTTLAWMALASEEELPMAPVHDATSVRADAQVRARTRWLPAATHGTDLMASPVRVEGGRLPDPRRAPSLGEDTEDVLRELLGYDEERVADLRSGGVLGGEAGR